MYYIQSIPVFVCVCFPCSPLCLQWSIRTLNPSLCTLLSAIMPLIRCPLSLAYHLCALHITTSDFLSVMLHVSTALASNVSITRCSLVSFAHSPSRAPRSSTSVLSLQTVWNDLRLDVFPRFLKDPLYTKYIRTKWFETLDVTPEDFTTFRVLGRGAFGSVSPIGALY